MSVIHIDGHQVEISDKIPRSLVVIVVSIAMMIWDFIIHPLLWPFYRGAYLMTATDDMLRQDGIPDPGRERVHVVCGLALVIALAILLYYAYTQWNSFFLICAFVVASFHSWITYAYNENRRENQIYPTIGGR